MMFSYEAANSSGVLVTGNMEASSSAELIRSLESRDLIVTEIKTASEEPFSLNRRASEQDILMSLHEMVTLLESGVSIAETIESQSHANYPGELRDCYVTIAAEIRKGGSFSHALESSNLKIPQYFFQLATAGELSGNLARSLRNAVDQYEYDLKTAQEFRNALVYPLILILTGIGAVLLMFIFVVPQFLPLIERSENLPLISSIVLTAGIWFNDNFILLMIGIVVLCFAVIAVLKVERYRQLGFDFLASLPLVGTWIKENETATWATLMAALLASHVDLLSALELAKKAVKGTRRRSSLDRVVSDIRAGESLANSLERAQALTSTGYNLIRAGEKSGKLAEMMRSVSILYDEGSRQRMKRMLALIEPLSILIIGSFVGLLILGVILAITSVNDVSF